MSETTIFYVNDQDGSIAAAVVLEENALSGLQTTFSNNFVFASEAGDALLKPLATVVIREGDDLKITFDNGKYLYLAEYYTVCQDGSCTVLISDGEEFVDINSASEGLQMLDGTNLLYIQGSQELLLTLVDDDISLSVVYEFIAGSNPSVPGTFLLKEEAGILTEVSAIASNSNLGLIAGGLLGVGAIAAAVGGSTAATAATVVTKIITASVLLGPLTDEGEGTKVVLYQADGINKLGDMTYNEATGLFELKYEGDYTGPVIAVLTDHDSATDYINEATKQGADIGDNALVTMSVLASGVTSLALSINEATTAAANKAGITASKDGEGQSIGGVSATPLTEASLQSANEAIATALGLEGVDLATAPAVAVINTDGAANTNANDYGVALAQLSQARQDTGKTITELAQDLANGVSDDGQVSNSITATLAEAANAVANDTAYANVTAVQTESTAGLAAIGTAATNNDASNLTLDDIASITGVTNVAPGDLAAYQTAIAAATFPSNPPTAADVQAVIDAVNNTVPTVTITSDADALKAGETATITFTLSKASNDFVAADVTVADGTLSNFAGSGTSYTATFTPTADSEADATFMVAADTFTDTDDDATGNADSATVTLTVDTSVPTIDTVTLSWGTELNAVEDDNNGTVTVATTGAEEGQTVTLNLGGTDYTGTVSGNSTSISVAAADLQALAQGTQSYTVSVSDVAGNAATTSTGSFTVDTTVPDTPTAAPALAVASNSGSTADTTTNDTTPTLTVATELDPAPKLLVNGTEVASSYDPVTGALTPIVALADGENTITYQAVDAAGNVSAASPALTITIDTTPPTVSSVVISGAESDGAATTDTLVVGDKVVVTVTMNEATIVTGTPQYTIDVGGVDKTASYVSGSGSTNLVFEYTVEASNTDAVGGITAGTTALALNSGTLVDAANNAATLTTPEIAASANTLVIDTTAPTVAITYQDASNNPVSSLSSGTTATVVFTLSEETADFTAADVNATGGTLSAFAQDGTDNLKYTATFTPAANSTIEGSVSVAANTFTDTAGNNNTAASATINIDTTAPTINTVTLSWGNTLNAAEDDSDGTVTVATTGAEDGQTVTFNVGGTNYTGTVNSNSTTIAVAASDLQALSQGTLSYTVNVSNAANNAAIETTGSFVVDTVAPTAPTVNSLSTIDTMPTITGTATLGTDESLTVVVNGATYSGVTVTSGVWSIDTSTATPSSGTLGTFTATTGDYEVTATVTDAAGNSTADTTTNEITIVPPLQVDSITSPNQIVIAGTTSADGTYTLVTDTSSLDFSDDFTPTFQGGMTVLDTTKPVYTYNDGTNDWYVWSRETSGYHISQLNSTTEWYWEGSLTGFATNPSLVVTNGGSWNMSSATADDTIQNPSSLTLDNLPTNSDATFTITFNEAVSTLNASSLSFVDAEGTAVDMSNWTLGTPTAGTDNKTWTVSVTPPTGANAVDVAIKLVVANDVTSAAGGSMADAYTQVNLQAFDTEIPTVTGVVISGAESDGITVTTAPLAVGNKVIVTVTMDEATIVTGTPQYTIDVGGTDKTASYVSGSGTANLVFEYIVMASDAGGAVTAAADALALNDGTLADAAGNSATLTTLAQTTTGVSIDDAPAIDMQANEAGIQLSSNSLLSNASLATGFSIASELAASTDTDIDQVNIVFGGGALDKTLDKLVIGGTDIAMNADITSTSVTVSIDGSDVTYNYAYTATTNTLVLTPTSGNFAGANVDDIIAGIQLKNTETTPAEGARTATITYEDVAGNTSQAGVSTITNTAPPLVTVSMNSVITDLPVITGSASTGQVVVTLDLDGDAIYGEATDDKSATYTVTVTNDTWSLDLSSVNPDGASSPISFADITAAQLAVQATATDATTGLSSIATEQASKEATSYSISSGQVIEDETADKVLTFVVTREGDLSQAGTVEYAFDADTSTVLTTGDNADVTGVSTTATTLTFAAGERFKTVDVTVKGDNLKELNEQVVLKLSNATQGSISEADGVGTILESNASDYAALFGLQDLNLAKETFAIRVRRSLDSQEMDIGFDKFGNLDTDALLRFVNNNSDGSAVTGAKGYVSVWYNQAGDKNLTQAQIDRQGVIVNEGAMVTGNDGTLMVSFNRGLNGVNNESMSMEATAGNYKNAEVGLRYQVSSGSNSTAFALGGNNFGTDRFQSHLPFAGNATYYDARQTRIAVNGALTLNEVQDIVFTYNTTGTNTGSSANNYQDASMAIFIDGEGKAGRALAGTDRDLRIKDTWYLGSAVGGGGEFQNALYGQFLVYLNGSGGKLGRADEYIGDNLNNAFSYAGDAGVTALDGKLGFDTVIVSGDGTNLDVSTLALTSIELIDLSQDANAQSVTLTQAQVSANGSILNVLMGSGDSVAYTPTGGTQTTITQSATQDMVVFGTTGDDTINMSAYDEVVYSLGGSDTFYYPAWSDAGTDSSQDTINGFTVGAGGDVLNLGDLLNGETLATLSDFIEVTDAGSGGDVTLRLDIDGTGGYSDLTIVLTDIGTGSLTLADLTASNIIIT